MWVDELIAIVFVAGWACIILLSYRWTVRALERRDLPRWHAWLGWVTLFELALIKPVRPPRTRETVSNAGLPLPTLDIDISADAPVPVDPGDGERS